MAGFNVTVTIREKDGILAGDGSWGYPGESVGMVLQGLRSGGSVAFKITETGYEPADFTGQLMSETRIVGKLNGSGFRGESLTLNKQ